MTPESTPIHNVLSHHERLSIDSVRWGFCKGWTCTKLVTKENILFIYVAHIKRPYKYALFISDLAQVHVCIPILNVCDILYLWVVFGE